MVRRYGDFTRFVACQLALAACLAPLGARAQALPQPEAGPSTRGGEDEHVATGRPGGVEPTPAAPGELSQSTGNALRLQEALRLALSNNERSLQAKLRIDAAEGAMVRARAAFLPSLSVAGTASANSTRASRGENAWTRQGSASLSQPIIQPSTWPQYAQQKDLYQAEEAGALQDKRVLGFDVARAYMQALAAESARAAARSRLERAQANLDVSRARAAAELSSTNDVTRATLDVASAAQSLANQEGNVRNSYLALGFLLGKEVHGPLEQPNGLTQTTALLAQGVEPLLTQVPKRRADLVELRERAEAASASAAEPYYRMLPTLSAQAQTRLVDNPAQFQTASDSTLTLNLGWAIFDGGTRYGDLRQRRAQAETAKLTLRLQERGAQVAVRQSVTSFDAAREAYDHAVEAVRAADRSIEETQVLYQQGLARAIELTTANGSRFDAEISRVSAKLSLEQACFDLRYALGLNPLDDGPGAPGETERSVK